MCLEFRRRLNPDLPFYYYTTSHECFVEGELPPFSEKADKPRKARRAPRREQPASQVGRQVTLVQRGPGSIRVQFHNVPVSLPPLPTLSEGASVASEHYMQSMDQNELNGTYMYNV